MTFRFNRIKCALWCILFFLSFSTVRAQNGFRFGLKIHPNISFSSINDKSQFDSKNFSLRNVLVGFNVGITTNYQKEKWLFEISSGLHTNATGVSFKKDQNISQLNFRTVSFSNEFSFGYQIFESNEPYYEIFLVPSISYNVVAMQRINSKGVFPEVTKYEQIYPSINETWKNVDLGIGIKIRTRLKNGRRFDYGLSYRYSLTKHPQFGMSVTMENKIYQSLARPNIHTLNIDFIYYFGKKRKSA